MASRKGILGALARFNWVQFAAVLALVAIGTIAIWSAGHARQAVVFHGMWRQTLSTAVFGLAVYFVLAFLDYRRLLDWGALPSYALAIVLLLAVLLLGTTVYGGRRWLWFFQPSEFSKLCVIVFFAHWFGGPGAAEENPRFRSFLVAAAALGVPALLILLEPDLGTTLTLVPAVLLIMLAAGVWRRGVVTLLAIGTLAAVALLGAVSAAERPGVSEQTRERILRFVPLRPHQLTRVKVFLYPENDPKGAGYTVRQSKISIGSGGFTGKGIGKGECNHLKYLPQAISMNDFIFCVYAEETGFVGALVLLSLYAILLGSLLWTAAVCRDDRGRLLALGVAMLIFAHVYVNIAMSLGLVPITGLPLPFISSGRTFLLTIILALGLVQSVSVHRSDDSGRIGYETEKE